MKLSEIIYACDWIQLCCVSKLAGDDPTIPSYRQIDSAIHLFDIMKKFSSLSDPGTTSEWEG